MGSFPGVVGSSGKHAHSFVPRRNTGGGSPSRAGQSRMVACRETDGGAALIAFWIFHAARFAAGAGVCAALAAAMASDATPTSTESVRMWFMGSLLERGGLGL